jgi:hypothetical protein
MFDTLALSQVRLQQPTYFAHIRFRQTRSPIQDTDMRDRHTATAKVHLAHVFPLRTEVEVMLSVFGVAARRVVTVVQHTQT